MFALPYIFGLVGRERLESKVLQLLKEYGRQTCIAVNNVQQKASGRPPNILIYTGKNCQSFEKFQRSKEFLRQCLDQDKYVIYQLQHELVLQEPWKDNTELLIMESDHVLDKQCENTFDSYVMRGGKLLSFSKLYTLNGHVRLCDVGTPIQEVRICEKLRSDIDKCLQVGGPIDTVFEVQEEENIDILAECSASSQPVIISVSYGDGKAILSTAQISLDTLDDRLNNERIDLLKMLLNYLGMTCGGAKKSVLTNAYLLGDEKSKEIFVKSIQDVLTEHVFKGNNISIHFYEKDNNDANISNDNLPVITNANPDQVSFNFPLYQEYLKTKRLGQLVVYSEVVTSTQSILNGSLKLVRKLPDGYGFVMVGRRQTVGKGRGDNAWLSPDGCLSFSFPLHVGLDSNLGQRLPFVQHIAALAVVDAVRGINGYQDIDIRIKWPNDIYFGTRTKIGGILVNSSIQGRDLYAVVGIGVNLDNSEPTTCINDVIEQRNETSTTAVRKLSREQLLATILSEMEELVEEFQQYGPKRFLEKYYLRWLHSNAKVNLGHENGEEVTIKGLDDMGFLSVINSLNEVQSVQPDGNSFDMMRNLITMKTRM